MGEVRFKRTVYQNKYKYLDPKLEALLVAKMASYSIAESARQINEKIYKDSLNIIPYISRQKARNILLRTDVSTVYSKLRTPETITVMLDEKWVSLQREEQAKEMVKTAV